MNKKKNINKLTPITIKDKVIFHGDLDKFDLRLNIVKDIEYEFEYQFDFTTGKNKLYINGLEHKEENDE